MWPIGIFLKCLSDNGRKTLCTPPHCHSPNLCTFPLGVSSSLLGWLDRESEKFFFFILDDSVINTINTEN